MIRKAASLQLLLKFRFFNSLTVYLEASVLLKNSAIVVLVLTGKFCGVEIDKKDVAGI